MRRFSILAVVAFATSAIACVPKNRNNAKVMTALGLASMVAATTLIAKTRPDDDEPSRSDTGPTYDFDFTPMLGAVGGGALLISGVVWTLGGLAGLSQTSTEAPPPAADFDPSGGLPRIDADSVSIRLAKQARALIRSGKCDSAFITARQIAKRDRHYADALVGGPIFERCRASGQL